MGSELMTGEDALRSQWPTIASFLTCGARRNIRRETSSGMGGKGDRSVRATERWNSEKQGGCGDLARTEQRVRDPRVMIAGGVILRHQKELGVLFAETDENSH
jgi:hypothetical protein